MFQVNPHYAKLPGSYLFAEIGRRVRAFQAANTDINVISLGIGDVSVPLTPAVIKALHEATDEMGTKSSFKGYGPEQGYDFLREAIVASDYKARGMDIGADEVFVSDGAKCDVGNFQELFADDVRIAVTDPVYPVYVDSNAMSGRTGSFVNDNWDKLIYLPCTAENNFVPDFPKETPDVIYLCYPNNPTGTVLNRDALKAWVDYARNNGAIILYDSAYKAFISGDDIPHSIYEIDGAREVAVEFRSYSKTAGFTGLRCAYTVVPKDIQVKGQKVDLNAMWNRRQCTKYNGCPYIVQKAAAAVHSAEGQAESAAIVKGYMDNATKVRQTLKNMGMEVYGGEHAPYVWIRTPKLGNGYTPSWDFFQHVLDNAHVVCTPGAGFGPSGETYARFTAFAAPANTDEALARLKASL